MSDTMDLLQIKIERAKAELPQQTREAIDTVDWKNIIAGLRAKKGYSFEQLGDLELETELMLCGLTKPEDYPEEISKRLGLSKAAANDLANEMNDLVFKKIREELIKINEREKAATPVKLAPSNRQENPVLRTEPQEFEKKNDKVLDSAGIKIVPPMAEKNTVAIRMEELGESREEMLKKIEKPEVTRPQNPVVKKGDLSQILMQKLSSPVQIKSVQTDHSVPNLSINKDSKPKVDPYREIPE